MGRVRVYRILMPRYYRRKNAPRSPPRNSSAKLTTFLGRKVQELQDQTFQLLQIDPVRDTNGAILYYDVTLRM